MGGIRAYGGGAGGGIEGILATAAAGPGRGRAFASGDVDYLSASHSIGAETTISMAAWIKISSQVGTARTIMGLFRSDQNDDGYLRMFLTTAGNLHAYIETDTPGVGTGNEFAGDLRDGEWHLVACAIDASTITVWVDDGTDTPANHSRTYPTIDTVAIGCRVDLTPDQAFEGDIDECSLWEGTKLTDAQVAAMYAIGIDSTKNYLTAFSDDSIPIPTHHWSLSATRNSTNVGLDEVGSLDLTDNGTADVEGIQAGEGSDVDRARDSDTDGASNNLSNSSTAINATDWPVSISVWVKGQQAGAAWGTVFACDDGTFSNRIFVVIGEASNATEANNAVVGCAGTGGADNNAAGNVNDDALHHILGVITSTQIRLWIDGVEQTPATAHSISYPTVLDGTYVFNSIGGAWDYMIDDITVWNSDQSANVATIYNGGDGLIWGDASFPAGAIHHWSLSRNTTSGIGKDSAGLLTLTETGTTVDAEGIPAGKV